MQRALPHFLEKSYIQGCVGLSPSSDDQEHQNLRGSYIPSYSLVGVFLCGQSQVPPRKYYVLAIVDRQWVGKDRAAKQKDDIRRR